MVISLLFPVVATLIYLSIQYEVNIPGNRLKEEKTVRLFLCGDVMTGRGIDQILLHPGDPVIHESYMKSALGYVRLAEKVNGNIKYPVDPFYIWGKSINYWEKFKPDIKIINLETSITSYDVYWPDKAVNYRMNPENIQCLKKPGIDYCALANNHVLDYGMEGMVQTLEVLKEAGIAYSGCGRNLEEARRPAIFSIPQKGRIIVFSVGLRTSGIPYEWAAKEKNGGVNLLVNDTEILEYLKSYLKSHRQAGDLVIVSIHWGSNWGYDIPSSQRQLAYKLIDEAGVDLIHGHSSHHFKGIEIYNDKPIIYGAGDFINDYEGIGGYEKYRGDLAVMYFLDISTLDGTLKQMVLIPLKIRRMQLQKASSDEVKWVQMVLNREGKTLNTRFRILDGYRIELIKTDKMED
jgi:poly-gamma-glutamate synthesis protein (capsule biosynthesis protein)